MDTKTTTTNKPSFRQNNNGAQRFPKKPFGAGGKDGKGPLKPQFNREKSEFDQKIINIRRVTRVVSGGRRMSFSVAMVIGDRKGSVGVGTGKAVDTALAINKAVKNARKNMVTVTLNKDKTIAHEVKAKYASARIFIMPNKGRGIVAGSSIRDIVALGGIKNITCKILSGSKNKLNIARATILALAPFSKVYTGSEKKAEVKVEEKVEVKKED